MPLDPIKRHADSFARFSQAAEFRLLTHGKRGEGLLLIHTIHDVHFLKSLQKRFGSHIILLNESDQRSGQEQNDVRECFQQQVPSIAADFRLLPDLIQLFHFDERRIADAAALSFQSLFDEADSPLKFVVAAAKGFLRVDLPTSREISHDK